MAEKSFTKPDGSLHYAVYFWEGATNGDSGADIDVRMLVWFDRP